MGENEQKNGYSIAALVLGICSLVLWNWGLINIACGICAIIFGKKGMKLAKVGLAKAGLIMGIISLSIWAVVLLIGVCTGAFLGVALLSTLV